MEKIIKKLENDLKISVKQIKTVLDMLEEGNTIPFISRYRKEATGGLDETEIKLISDEFKYQKSLFQRKEDVIRLIEEKGLMNDELKNQINNATKLVEVEDLYLPYKEKKKTKATKAIELGLMPLAEEILKFGNTSLEQLAQKYETEELTIPFILEQAGYIIAENISDSAKIRQKIRNIFYYQGTIITKEKKKHTDELKKYELYYNFAEAVKKIKPYRILAINRAENEKVISVNIEEPKEFIYQEMKNLAKFPFNHQYTNYLDQIIKDAYKRLIAPAIIREIRTELNELASKSAIEVFATNLDSLLMQAPLKDCTILGIDPAFRTGCKLAVIDETGKSLEVGVIYPTEPKNDYEGSKKKVLELIKKYNVKVISIGNGTASQETSMFIAKATEGLDVGYVVVNEAGASVYSASPLAIKEFPDLAVEQRSAISIARRLQDPLPELIKIDPKSIGVGQYQHDVNQKELKEKLDFVIEAIVNKVGVDINRASSFLLSRVAGINQKLADEIVKYREENGKFINRKEFLKIPKFSKKVFTQASGFLRILDQDPIEKTGIHPESYKLALSIMKEFDINKEDLGSNMIKEKLSKLNTKEICETFNTDSYTLEDIIKDFIAPLRDPRDESSKPLIRTEVLKIEMLKENTQIVGTIKNVVEFGAFVDLGIKEDGLVHISKITKDFIKHPAEILTVGQIMTFTIEKVDLNKRQIGLTLLK